MEKANLFDLDDTLLTVNSSFSFGVYLYKNNFYSTLSMLKLVGFYSLHKFGFLNLKELHTKIFNQIFISCNATSIKQHVKSFVDQNLKKLLYVPAVKRLEDAKKNLHFVAILSSSPDFIVAEIAAFFGVDDWKATAYDIDQEGKFSKISSFFLGADKAEYLKNLCKRFNLEKENTIAYSDSLLDLPFLKAAGVAVCVNPDKKLEKLAHQNHWEII